eukprot:TRINITY_DN46388_c0_g1_i1.p1 TRINITY_DN46388_c0_g1~~TRINITY_DN46388_c0_g1_i1.p1  ORF type:complete len:507 (+),score=38.94 TRINITY_DN46388_c0_g1_i1:133-1521(+)
MTPAYEETVKKVVVGEYGVDHETKCDIYANYVQPHVLRGDDMAQKQRVHRKEVSGDVADESAQNSTKRGFVNICVEFLHSSLAFINPPVGWTHDETTAFIREKLDVRLRHLAQRGPLSIRFDAHVKQGRAVGGRNIWFIGSDATLRQQSEIAYLREQMQSIFSENGFCVRWPREQGGNRQIHMTIRDGRYESCGSSTPSIPKKTGFFDLLFDRLVVTPAGENDPRHSFRRQYCGATHDVPLLLPRPRVLEDEAVIMRVRHVEAPAAVDPQADAHTAALLVRDAPTEDLNAPMEKVFILKFGSSKSGSGEEFRTRLLRAEQLKPFIDELKRSDYPHVLPSKALIFVKPDQYADVMSDLKDHSVSSFHVIATESMITVIREVLQSMPYASRPHEKVNSRREVDLSVKFEIERTFLCEAPKLFLRGSVVQSTTDAVISQGTASSSVHRSNYYSHNRGMPPRRYIA